MQKLYSDPSDYTVIKLANGAEFVYFGIAQNLKRAVNTKLHENQSLLQFNVDGLPLYRSSIKQFWPILGKVFLVSDLYKPFPVAIWCGKGKPESFDQYLDNFILELNDLLKNGITIEDIKFEVKCNCFICDKRARAQNPTLDFVLLIGAPLKGIEKKTTIFSSSNSPKRTFKIFKSSNKNDDLVIQKLVYNNYELTPKMPNNVVFLK